MSIDRFYFAENEVPALGAMLFLRVLQSAKGSASDLLGSIVESRSSGGFFGLGSKSYPVPMLYTVPQVVLGALTERSSELGLAEESLVQTTTFAGFSNSIVIGSEAKIGGGVQAFPALPVSIGVDVDYERMKKVKLSFGAGTKLSYIPKGYLARLYRAVGGNARTIDPALRKHFIVDRVLVTREFEVAFESTEAFGSGFEAQLELGRAEVRFDKKNEREVVAKVSGNQAYIAALGARSWDDFGA